MGYQIKFSQLQKTFFSACSQFHELRYKDVSSLWVFSGGHSPKPPSSLLKKAQELGILNMDRTEGGKNTKYIFNKDEVRKVLSDKLDTRNSSIGTDISLPIDFQHDQLLQRLMLVNLPIFKGYQLTFPVDKSYERLVPDVILANPTNNHTVIVEYDNDTERRFDFVSKFPRLAEEYSDLENGSRVDIIFVFKGLPTSKMVTFINTIQLTKTFSGENIGNWIRKNTQVNMYFISEYSWPQLSASLIASSRAPTNTNSDDIIENSSLLSSTDIRVLYYYNILYYLSFENSKELHVALEKVGYANLQDLPYPPIEASDLVKYYSIPTTIYNSNQQDDDVTTSLFI